MRDNIYRDRKILPETNTGFYAFSGSPEPIIPPPFSLASTVGQIPSFLNMIWWDTNYQYSHFDQLYGGVPVWGFHNSSKILNTIIAPDGTATGTKIVEDSSNSTHYLAPDNFVLTPTVTSTAAVPWRCAAIVTPGERTRVVLSWSISGDANSVASVGFDLAGVSVFDSSAGSNVTISNATATALRGGWVLIRFDVRYSPTTENLQWDAKLFLDAGSGASARNTTYTGDGSSGAYIWWWNILPAPAWNINHLTFADEFDSLDNIDLTNSKAPNFNWYVNNTWVGCGVDQAPLFCAPPSPSLDFTISSPSVLKVFNPNNNVTPYTSQLQSAAWTGGTSYVGHAFQPPLVVDTYSKFDPSLVAFYVALGNTNWPALWGVSVESLLRIWDANHDNLEIDTQEAFPAGSLTTTFHNLNINGDVAFHSTLVAGNIPYQTDFVRMSTIWIPSTYNDNVWGIFLGFNNGQYMFQGDQGYTSTSPVNNTWIQTESLHLTAQIITAENTSASADQGLPFYVDWYRIYQV